jgi:protein TonB
MIALVDKDVDDVEMIFSRTVTVTTNVVVDGGGVVPNFALALVPYRGGQTTVSLAYTGLGEVRTRVPEGDYRVAWSSLPAGYQIKSITTGMTDLLVNPFKVAIEGNPPHIAVNLGVSSPPPWVAVSGRITGLTQADFAGPLRLSLVPRENGATPETAIQEDGSFEFPMVLPGPYAVRLTPRGPIPDLTAIAVRSRDIRGLEIAAPPGKPVTIRFAVEGNGPPPRTMELVLDGVSTGSHLSQPDGTFRVRFPLGTHRVTLGVGSYTMKEMRYGGADVIRQPMVVALTDTAELLVSVGRNINVSVSIDASGPNCVTCPAPPYPEPARATAITDTVVLSVSVAADGTVQDVKVIRGHQLLAQAAVDAVRQWRFRPQPAPAQASVAISFDAR